MLEQIGVGIELFTACVKQFMERVNDKRSEQVQNEPQPGNMNSFNQRNKEKSSEAEDAKKNKEENEAVEANEPLRTKE
ncbi:hypothetical protein [Flavisolibacter ginsenosidimutans]|uniref:Uncharacterized protein n=1 Tax=Flavisolibacter ginsenosidimutans TaxID=661481 RepID=A0A5B8UJA3_9BACT|nr:hypothetical protein [Flavisolibacter ginsenosidimutans]QEC56085.1 hypothetical protein FSB75_09320 [Flavisolibacter ginsenosidimutans]